MEKKQGFSPCSSGEMHLGGSHVYARWVGERFSFYDP
jgi:hypothetical protein